MIASNWTVFVESRMNQSAELEFLQSTIETFQKTPYVVLKHDGKYYKCYELKELNNNESKDSNE